MVGEGATIRYWGGGAGVLAWPIFFYFTREIKWKALFFHLRISTMHCGHLFISQGRSDGKLYFSTSVFPPCIVAIYLFHPFSPQKYLFLENSTSPPPPSILMVGPLGGPPRTALSVLVSPKRGMVGETGMK